MIEHTVYISPAVVIHRADLLEQTCLRMGAGLPGGDSPQAELCRSDTSEMTTNSIPSIIFRNGDRFFPINKCV